MNKTIKTAALIILIALSAHAKERPPLNDNGSRGLPRAGSSANTDDITGLPPAGIEARFRPFFEGRAESRRAYSDGGKRAGQRQTVRNTIRPSQKDLLIIMRKWDDLTPEFKALYKEATAIPSGLESYVSPSGRFKIFYTASGIDSVDATDTIGYGGGGPSSWRNRYPIPNGIPDYVDVAAFGLDSAWSMIIDRFGFPAPRTTPGPSGETDRYNVLIANLNDENLYGATYPQDGRMSSANGFSSHIEINSSWPSNMWGSMGYDKRPYDAVLVTAAHEFFHAPQYAMVRTVIMDDIPYGWLEGSAVLMEEIAFPEINDYLQYIGGYFRNPARVSLVSNSDEYLNGIVLKYIYEKSNPLDSIGLVKAVHFYNRDNAAPPFHRNIELASQEYAKKSWAELLNRFHAESYFTGKRARRPGTFIGDAELMGAWTLPAADAAAQETKSVRPHSAGFFLYTPQASHADTLVLSISGVRDASITGKTWAANVLVMERDSDSAEIAPVAINQSGSGYFTLENWKDKGGCLLIVTNGSGNSSRSITVKIERSAADIDTTKPDTLKPNTAPLAILPNVVRPRQSQTVHISGGEISEITIVSTEGKLLGRWNTNGPGSRDFQSRDDGSVEWTPNRRLTPGIYVISAKSTNPQTGKKESKKRKIMVLP
ncbi:MAG: hypothetical protein FWB85_01855 [Chitinispirillia bacterium]|nr:hypothetical protein [Chitinispirillia bacterium]MCL2241138.1 hypothetical protein [Chitinispirillia bacterium]